MSSHSTNPKTWMQMYQCERKPVGQHPRPLGGWILERARCFSKQLGDADTRQFQGELIKETSDIGCELGSKWILLFSKRGWWRSPVRMNREERTLSTNSSVIASLVNVRSPWIRPHLSILSVLCFFLGFPGVLQSSRCPPLHGYTS